MLYTYPIKVELASKYDYVKDIHSRMSIWFDEHFYDENRDDYTCFRYLYLIYHMLARVKHFFFKFEDYDNYAQFAASTIYMRFIRKQENGERIKSVLNYAKKTANPLKVMYQNAEFRNVVDVNKDPKSDITLVKNYLRDNVQSQYNDGLSEDVCEMFKTIPYMIKKALTESPYRSDSVEYRRIYVSCLITLLKSFTLSNKNIIKLKKAKEDNINISDETICKMYNKEREYSTSVWRLSPSMGNYIQLITNKVRKMISEEMSEIKSSYTIDDDTLDAILMSAWECVNTNDVNDGEDYNA